MVDSGSLPQECYRTGGEPISSFHQGTAGTLAYVVVNGIGDDPDYGLLLTRSSHACPTDRRWILVRPGNRP